MYIHINELYITHNMSVNICGIVYLYKNILHYVCLNQIEFCVIGFACHHCWLLLLLLMKRNVAVCRKRGTHNVSNIVEHLNSNFLLAAIFIIDFSLKLNNFVFFFCCCEKFFKLYFFLVFCCFSL